MKLFVGVDPGTPPTIAALIVNDSGATLSLTFFEDHDVAVQHTHKTRSGNIGKTFQTSPELLGERLYELTNQKAFSMLAVERVSMRPGENVASGQKFIGSMYMVVGACGVLAINYRAPVPGVWKRDMALPGKKKPDANAIIRQVAVSEFPAYASRFSRVKDHNRAEAALLALWASRHGAAYAPGMGGQ